MPAFVRAGRPPGRPDRETIAEMLAGVRRAGRTVLTKAESREFLASYGIRVVETHIASSEDAAEALGDPVVVKLHPKTITHKTDVGGVRRGLGDPRKLHGLIGKSEVDVKSRPWASWRASSASALLCRS